MIHWFIQSILMCTQIFVRLPMRYSLFNTRKYAGFTLGAQGSQRLGHHSDSTTPFWHKQLLWSEQGHHAHNCNCRLSSTQLIKGTDKTCVEVGCCGHGLHSIDKNRMDRSNRWRQLRSHRCTCACLHWSESIRRPLISDGYTWGRQNREME